ncbi:hypothetical protein F5882DRAFT_56389 [Hyaloscypha sp. PMI_1271]|nr:hypothetical protein F5882DRAFT_56389 [Hyaloscypha sp. PMI_1271]
MPWKLKAFTRYSGLEASMESSEAAAIPPHPRSAGETPAAQSLWDRAYVALHAREPRLMGKYESLLSQQQPAGGLNSKTEPSNPSTTGRGTDNRVYTKRLSEQQSKSDAIVRRSLEDMDKKSTKFHVFGREFVVKDQVAQAVILIQGLKSIIDEAVKASPEASLAWTGVCVILPLLTNPSIAEQASSDGFTYVTSRMSFYIALEPLLLPKDMDGNITVPDDLRVQFEANLVDLYSYILEFQFKCVLRFYSTWRHKISADILQPRRWETMLGKIKERERRVTKDTRGINDAKSIEELELGNNLAQRSLETMDQLLFVEHQQLQVTKDMLQALQQILGEIRLLSRPGTEQTVGELGSRGLGGHISKSDDQLQIGGGDGGSAFVSWEFLQSSSPFNAQGGDGGDAAVGSSGLFAGQGRGGRVLFEAKGMK